MVMYIGPTMLGVASRNQVFNEDDLPAGLRLAVSKRPYLGSLLVDTEDVARNLTELTRRKGATYNLYLRASKDSKAIESEVQKGE